MELVEPGLVIVPDWRPEPPAVRDHPVLEMACVGVAHKPLLVAKGGDVDPD
jgi:hypothetical protein